MHPVALCLLIHRADTPRFATCLALVNRRHCTASSRRTWSHPSLLAQPSGPERHRNHKSRPREILSRRSASERVSIRWSGKYEYSISDTLCKESWIVNMTATLVI